MALASARSKTELRQAFRTKLEGVSSQDRAAREQSLNRKLVSLLSNKSGTWAAFQPHGFEPNIRPALTELTNIQWAFPRVQEHHIEFFKTDAAMNSGAFGIQEPGESAAHVSLDELEGLLVPGLVFDTEGTRLGRGRGFYDRVLSREELKNKPKIGIAFDQQVTSEALPSDPHDIPMNLVLTDAREISPSGRKVL
jgi:5-formyltetrahydrofolate cyclo-ligase